MLTSRHGFVWRSTKICTQSATFFMNTCYVLTPFLIIIYQWLLTIFLLFLASSLLLSRAYEELKNTDQSQVKLNMSHNNLFTPWPVELWSPSAEVFPCDDQIIHKMRHRAVGLQMTVNATQQISCMSPVKKRRSRQAGHHQWPFECITPVTRVHPCHTPITARWLARVVRKPFRHFVTTSKTKS